MLPLLDRFPLNAPSPRHIFFRVTKLFHHVAHFQRFSDFHVREISVDGETAVLSSYELPVDKAEDDSHDAAEASATVKASSTEPIATGGEASKDDGHVGVDVDDPASGSQELLVDSAHMHAIGRITELLGHESAVKLEKFAAAQTSSEDYVRLPCDDLSKVDHFR